jgi:hypothetical protein
MILSGETDYHSRRKRTTQTEVPQSADKGEPLGFWRRQREIWGEKTAFREVRGVITV